jgi:hypothetical protein
MTSDYSKNPHVMHRALCQLLNEIETLNLPGDLKAAVKKRALELKSEYESSHDKPRVMIDDGSEIPENLDEIVEDILRRSREAEERESKSGKREPKK